MNTDKVKLFDQHKYESIQWSPEEKVFQHTRKHREKIFDNYTLCITSALLLKYKESILGSYLDIFNCSQNQDKCLNENKFGITQFDIKKYTQRQLKRFETKNNILGNYMEVLNNAVKFCEVIDLDYVVNTTTKLDLTSCCINVTDPGLRNFQHLRILFLTGNNLRDLDGTCLPSGLLYLELYDNFISDLKNLVTQAPKHLLHLGLGRNKLTNDSSLHLLAESGNFQRLQNLDLSNNDIYNLEPAMLALEGLKSLKTFSLEGNPCSVVVPYRPIVLTYLPQIVYLDNVEVIENDQNGWNKAEDGSNKAQVIFRCYRIMGLPKLPKDNKSIQTIHVEVGLPLLEEPHFPEDHEPEKNLKHSKSHERELKKSDKSKSKMTFLSSNTTETTGKGKKTSPYAKPDEYSAAGERNNFYFKSVRMPWQKIIEFPPIMIEPPEGDLVSVRDTFRSAVNVRVVYLKVAKPTKSKQKGAGVKKEEKKSNRMSKSTKSRKSTELEVANHVEVTEDINEIILKRVTLCHFVCNMSDMNWSDETIDFYWADHINMKSSALRVDGCLKLIKYAEKPEKPKPNNKKPGSSTTSSIADINIVNPLPKIFTCQVGFGIIRSVPNS